MSFGPKGVAGILFIALAAIGAVFILGSVISTNITAWNGAPTTGAIVGFEEVRTSKTSPGKGRTTLTLFSFTTREGEERLERQHIWFAKQAYNVGDRVPVRYDPKDREAAVLDTFLSRFSFLIILPFMAPFFAMGFWLLKRDKREQDALGWSNRRF